MNFKDIWLLKLTKSNSVCCKEGLRNMRLIMTLLVRDEADIIRQNIEYHLGQGVDQIVAVDNGSKDGTRDILEDFAKAGAVHVIDEPGRDYSQHVWVTNAADVAREHFEADWIINNDADEFWLSESGNLKDEFSNHPEVDILRIERYNLLTSYQDLGRTSWSLGLAFRIEKKVSRPKNGLSDIYRDALPAPYFFLDLPPKVAVRANGLLSIEQGNHSASFDRKARESESEMKILHFPVRSPDQFEKKICQGGSAYAANSSFPESVGWHWRRWYKMFQRGGIQLPLKDALPDAHTLRTGLQDGTIIREPLFDWLSQRMEQIS